MATPLSVISEITLKPSSRLQLSSGVEQTQTLKTTISFKCYTSANIHHVFSIKDHSFSRDLESVSSQTKGTACYFSDTETRPKCTFLFLISPSTLLPSVSGTLLHKVDCIQIENVTIFEKYQLSSIYSFQTFKFSF